MSNVIRIGAKQPFYKDIRLIVHCRECGLLMRPPRGSFEAIHRICYECRPPFFVEWYKKYRKPYLKRLSPEARREQKKKEYLIWLCWVEKNKEKRKKQALKSYHRRKRWHKGRKHRRTRSQEA